METRARAVATAHKRDVLRRYVDADSGGCKRGVPAAAVVGGTVRVVLQELVPRRRFTYLTVCLDAAVTGTARIVG